MEELNISSLIENTGNPFTNPTIYPVIIHCDNQHAIAPAKNLQAYAGSKHIDIQLHYQREKVENRSVEPWYISTNQQIVGGPTKLLLNEKFLAFRNALGME